MKNISKNFPSCTIFHKIRIKVFSNSIHLTVKCQKGIQNVSFNLQSAKKKIILEILTNVFEGKPERIWLFKIIQSKIVNVILHKSII